MLTTSATLHIITFASRRNALVDTDCGVWLSLVEHLVWDQGVAGSNPVTPSKILYYYTCRCGSMVEHQPSKLNTWVRFPSPAFLFYGVHGKKYIFFRFFNHIIITKKG